jgi:uncharacterized protein (TIGR03437 family)
VRLTQPARIIAKFNGISVTGFLQISTTGIGRSLHSPGISCSPHAVHAGGQVACEVQIVPGSPAEPIQVTSSSEKVKVPAVISARAQHSSLTFQAVTEPSARLQSATVTATVGDVQVTDAVLVLPADGPVLTVPARKLVRIGERVSFAARAVDPGDLPVQLAATGLPEGASFDLATGVFSWIPDSSQGGSYTLTFTATNSAGQTSTARVSLEAGRGAPMLDASAVSCSPNAIGVLNGGWLVNGEPITDPSGEAFELGGTRVRVNDQEAPILFASPTEVHFVCPVLSTGTNLAIVVETPEGTTGPLYSTMQAVSPRVLSLDGAGQALISFAGTNNLVTARTYRLPGQPAQPGDQVSLWATGLGLPDQIDPGRVAVKFGDLYAGAESVHRVSGYAGIEGVEVQVPATAEPGSAVPVCIEVLSPEGQQVTSNCAYTAVEANRE